MSHKNILTLFAVLLTASSAINVCADDTDYKLQPLKYNNPGLVVDLGVGLWAWPMPMDYDKDGDLDLLVACPDKPSRGVYFFENTTQDPKKKFPVFKAGVRVGQAHQNMMMSMVDGEPVILRPAYEYRRESKSGKFDFAKPTRIDAPANPNRQRTRANMWRYVDYDGDGDHDIVVGSGDWSDLGWDHAYDARGNWQNGPLHGYVYLMTNEGDDQSPKYSKAPKRLHAGGREIDVYGWPSPNFADFDGDGDLDLLCGEFMDGFTYFQNTGSRKEPKYAVGRKLRTTNGAPLVMHVQMITPTAVDWDRDGDIDLIVGDEDGRVALIENTGSIVNAAPQFLPPQFFQQEADTLKFGALATPCAYDWDGDGDEDILCGNTAGNIALFDNLGMAANGLPKWDAPKLLEVRSGKGSGKPFRVMAGPNGSIQGPCEAKWGYTTLSVADIDKDGDPDIVFNSILARIGLLINERGALLEQAFDSGQQELPPKWYSWQTKSSATLTQWRTTPVAIDFDKDESMDLVLLDQEGFLTLRSNAGKAQRIFVDEDNKPIRLNAGTCGRSGRVKLAVVDWDGDDRLDVLVNSQNATWYRNCETREGKIVLKKIGNLAKRNVAGHTSSPAACDFNKDGKPDLLVGSENGRIYHIAHDDCVSFDEKDLLARPAKKPAKQKFAGIVQEEFIFTQAPFKECHASTVCSTSRGLVAAWFAGTKEGKKDVGIWVSYHDGLNWSRPAKVADGLQYAAMDGKGEPNRHPCWNPVLYQTPGDGPTLLFFKVGPNPREWWGEMMVSYDRGRTFRDRRRLPEGIDGPVRCKPILLADGETLLCGSSTEYDGWRLHFESVRLAGGLPTGAWKRTGPTSDASVFNAIQPTFMQHPDGQLQVLCRTKEGMIATSTSRDAGKTWTKLTATDLPNPNSGIEVVTLADGRHLLIYNHLGSGKTGWGRRGMLNLAVSSNGKQWHKVGVLEQETKAEFSYPAIIQTDDGLVHMTYTWKRKRVKHVVLDPGKIQQGPELKKGEAFP